MTLSYTLYQQKAAQKLRCAPAQAATGYVLDTTASINKVTKTITVPQSGTARFYRLQGANQTTITSTTVVGANVVMTYQ
jgi:hypothetical protein